jgi:hypothetical protein
MKKILILISMLLIFTKLFCNDTLYYSYLKNSIEQAYKAWEPENYRQLANCSERIIMIYKNEWLPYYYDAYAYINMSFMNNSDDKKEAYCDKAQVFLDSAIIINPNESELYVLQSLLYFARMAISPMMSGPLYYAKSAIALDDAEKLDSLNPRIYYLKAKSTIHTPKFLGGGKEAAIPIFERAVLLYNNFRCRSIVHPNWGKEDNERLLKECKIDLAKTSEKK